MPKKGSLLYRDGNLFMFADNGVATCVDAATGKVIWSERLKGEFDASPIMAHGRIYCLSKDGKVFVLAAQPEFKVLAEAEFDDGFMASPAVYKDSLILRSKSAVYRIGS